VTERQDNLQEIAPVPADPNAHGKYERFVDFYVGRNMLRRAHFFLRP
jgi:hypothetical protein